MPDSIRLTTEALRREFGIQAEPEARRRLEQAKALQDETAIATWNAVLVSLSQSVRRKPTAGVWPSLHGQFLKGDP